MKKAVKILMVFFFSHKNFLNWIVNQCPTTLVNMTQLLITILAYFFFFSNYLIAFINNSTHIRRYIIEKMCKICVVLSKNDPYQFMYNYVNL